MTAREHEAAVPLGTGAMFDRIAGRYDFLNRVISLGLDLRWRRLAIDALDVGTSSKVLDLATGTADLAIEVAKRGAEVHVVGLDPSPKMLEVGRVKLAERALDRRVELVLGDAAALPFEDASFDRVSMAFGIRNMPDRPKVLAEIARVLRPGGRLAILELSTPERGLLASAARIHIH
ncbi:ubiquinone/menaquinone biosynthesis methyltransferase, partial [Myxococcota bacterium]|nr:ubiquinone/menaquinone biosynthesis methyltransferase [Myxococcota bacterium]